MSKGFLFGFVMMMGVLAWSIEGSWSVYLQLHSIIIVIGGTLALIFFSIPFNVIKNIASGIKLLFQGKSEGELAPFQNDVIELSKTKSLSQKSGHELINYAAQLWEQGIDPDLFVALISQKRNDLINEKSDAVHSLKNLAKYPPALGMMGTVMGMISLFTQLDSAQSNVGQNLALAMTATFFGLFVANGFLNPLADRLHIREVSYKRLCMNLYELILLINNDEPLELLEEEVKQRVA
ncbi:MAG: MotA/TolQ/ExbB proton channel family protein [Bdellovibrionales bacterium]|nr:MotA/TolQ/ExbB proton channel family protein [Bdellovibrionales bacterium]